MGAKEQYYRELNEAIQPILKVVDVGLGGLAAYFYEELQPDALSQKVPLSQDLALKEKFLELITNSEELMQSHSKFLPGIENDIRELRGQVGKLGFDYRAGLIGVASIIFFRRATKPLFAEMAKKSQEKGNLDAAVNWRRVDNFWLATQTFLMVNMLNTVFHGGPNNQLEEGLGWAGGAVFIGGVVHTLIKPRAKERKS